METTLYLDKQTGHLWYFPLWDIDTGSTLRYVEIEGHEIFSCAGPFYIPQEKHIMIFGNDNDEYTMLLVSNLNEGEPGVYYSPTPSFGYRHIELFRGKRNLIAVFLQSDGFWRAEEIIAPATDRKMKSLAISETLNGTYSFRCDAIRSVSPQIEQMEKIFSTYHKSVVEDETLLPQDPPKAEPIMESSPTSTGYNRKYTPSLITKENLGLNEIFVFGSNRDGMHGAGAAAAASRYFGAIWGKGEGIQGRSYAIPTIPDNLKSIGQCVDRFITYAKEHSDKVFLVTRLGCGIAGHTEDEIAPLFAEAINIENIILPEEFVAVLEKQ